MSELRALAISIAGAALIAAYTILFWRWPLALGLATGVFLGGLALVTSVSLGADPADADEAWRAEAADLAAAATETADRNPLPRRPRAAPRSATTPARPRTATEAGAEPAAPGSPTRTA
jgi:hypothetical protein